MRPAYQHGVVVRDEAREHGRDQDRVGEACVEVEVLSPHQHRSKHHTVCEWTRAICACQIHAIVSYDNQGTRQSSVPEIVLVHSRDMAMRKELADQQPNLAQNGLVLRRQRLEDRQ